MELGIGAVIYRLRKEHGITQEQLANAVGVSSPAVSKWESGGAYPDITLLAPLARFFGTTVDTLLSYEQELSEERVMEIEKDCAEKFESMEFNQAVHYAEDFLQEYPNSPFLKFRMAGMMWQFIPKAGSEEKADVFTRQLVTLLENAAQNAEPKIQNAARIMLSSLYMMVKELDKAEKILNSMPKMEINSNTMLPSLYVAQGKLEKAKKLDQQTLFSGVNIAVMTLFSMATIAMKQEHLNDALKLAETQQALIALFQLENIHKITNCNLFIYVYSAMKNKEKALYFFSEYVDYILKLDYSKPHLSNIAFFSLLENVKNPTVTSDYVRNNLIKVIKEDPHYEFVRNTEEYRSIIKKFE
jgi:transcriptional regulator with XRE-family HTH domain